MKKQKDEQLFSLQKEAAVIQADLDHVEKVTLHITLHPYTLIPLQVLRELESPRKVTESSGLSMDGENSSDTSVVPTLEDRTEPRWGLDTSTLLNTDTTLRHYTPTLHSNTRPNSPLQGPGRLQFAGGQGCLS